MIRPDYIASLRAQGLANAHAAVAQVREWGGALEISVLRRNRLGRWAARAVRLGLLARVDGSYRSIDELTAATSEKT